VRNIPARRPRDPRTSPARAQLTPSPVRPRSSRKESAVTTASNPDTEVRRSLCSTKRQRRPRRSCCDSSAQTARPRLNWRSSDASTLSSAVTRRRRALRWCFRLCRAAMSCFLSWWEVGGLLSSWTWTWDRVAMEWNMRQTGSDIAWFSTA